MNEDLQPLHLYVGSAGRSDRPYREASSAEELMSELSRQVPDRVIPLRHLPGFSIAVCGGARLIRRDDGVPVGVMGRFRAPYVSPEFLGKGIASSAHFEIDTILGRVAASSYTMEGFRARTAAHRLHVNSPPPEGGGFRIITPAPSGAGG